jgi:hypothetical protein
VTGTGFLSSIAVNDYICVGTIFYQVKSIESNTSLTLYTAASANSTSFKIIKQNRLISRTGGSNISILPLPADGYHFSGWSDGKSNNSDNTRSDTLVDAVVYANFAQKYTISYISSEGDSTVSSSSAGGTVVLG